MIPAKYTLSYGCENEKNMKIKKSNIIPLLVAFFCSVCVSAVSSSTANSFLLNDDAYTSYAINKELESNNSHISLSITENGNRGIVNTFYAEAAYNLSRRYVACDGKAIFSCAIQGDGSFYIKDKRLSINNLISVSKNVGLYLNHEYNGQYLGFKIVTGLGWKETNSKDFIYIQEKHAIDICEINGVEYDGATFLEHFQTINYIDKYFNTFTFKIAGVISQESTGKYNNLYKDFILVHQESLIDAFSHDYTSFEMYYSKKDVQGLEHQLSYLKQLIGKNEKISTRLRYNSDTIIDFNIMHSSNIRKPYIFFAISLFIIVLFSLLVILNKKISLLVYNCPSVYLLSAFLSTQFLIWVLRFLFSIRVFGFFGYIIDHTAIFVSSLFFIIAIICLYILFKKIISKNNSILLTDDSYETITI